MEKSGESESIDVEVRNGFKDIFTAVQLSWARMITGLRVFQFQVCGRLASVRKLNVIVDAYLQSVEKCTPKPYLLPVNSFFLELDSALIMEVPVGPRCLCVANSPCGRYIAVGAEADIVVAERTCGEILQRLRGHTNVVTCIEFTAGWNKIVSGSADGKIMVWEWESSEWAVQVLEGHDEYVSGIAVYCDEGHICSCSHDGSMRIWDMSTGTQTEKLCQADAVYSVAVCAEKPDDCAWVVPWNIDCSGLRVKRCAFRR